MGSSVEGREERKLMEPRTIIITGASDGVGAAAARRLVAAGEQVVLVGRNPAKTQAVAAELGRPFHVADFASLAQVRELASQLAQEYPRIDVLANNAGGIMGQRTLTEDGFERTFQVNHLAGFVLTTLLLDRLLAAKATVIQTSSVAAAAMARPDLDDVNAEHSYSAARAYGNAKLFNILFTRELHRRFHNQGLATAAFHPGVVASNFASQGPGFMRLFYANPLSKKAMVSSEQGSDQLVWLAEGKPGSDWISGSYYEKRVVQHRYDQARFDTMAQQLWELSESLVQKSS